MPEPISILERVSTYWNSTTHIRCGDQKLSIIVSITQNDTPTKQSMQSGSVSILQVIDWMFVKCICSLLLNYTFLCPNSTTKIFWWIHKFVCTLNICRLPIFLTVSFFVDSIYCDWRKYLGYLESKARKLLILNAYGLYVVFNDGNSIYPLNTPPSQVFSVHFQISSIVFPNQLKLLF